MNINPNMPVTATENDKRAARALQALCTYRHVSGSDMADAVSDLLCDLMHLSERIEGQCFNASLTRARRHHHDETY